MWDFNLSVFITVPLPEHKTTADYMEGLFHLELKLKQEKSEKETNTSARSSPDLLQSLPKSDGNQLAVGRYPDVPSPLSNGETSIDAGEAKRYELCLSSLIMTTRYYLIIYKSLNSMYTTN